jgi:hypothetical protein
MKSFFDQLHLLSPLACRMLARRRTDGIKMVPLTNEEIATTSGLPLAKVRWLMTRKSWTGVRITVHELEAYLLGCGITPANISGHIRYIQRTAKKKIPMPHLSLMGVKMKRRIYEQTNQETK